MIQTLINLNEIKIGEIPEEKERLLKLINSKKATEQSRNKYRLRLKKLEKMEKEYWRLRNQ